MSSFTAFTAPLDVRYDAEASRALGADHWRVTQPFRFYVGSEDSGEWVNVPAGYLTDGASVPQVLWSLIPPWGAYGQAAVVHDLVCEYLSITVDGQPHAVTRAECDAILLEAMAVLGVPVLKRQAIYQAVSLYRVASGVSKPTSPARKRALEAKWAG
ncbi:MAG: DUF1353 domain-containing protein [Pseudomonas sp.]